MDWLATFSLPAKEVWCEVKQIGARGISPCFSTPASHLVALKNEVAPDDEMKSFV